MEYVKIGDQIKNLKTTDLVYLENRIKNKLYVTILRVQVIYNT